MEQSKIWDFFQNNESVADDVFNSSTRYKFLAEKASIGSDVLNIGVGRGGLESFLLKNKVNVYSLDPSEKSINYVKERYKLGERAKVGFSQVIPFEDDSFDVVIMTEVLEHLDSKVLQETISECHRVLRKGGIFIGTVPADEKLSTSLVVCPCCDNKFHRWGHVQSFSYINLHNLISGRFEKVKIKRQHFGNWGELNLSGKLGCFIKKILIKLGRKGDNENYYFSGEK